MKKVLIVLLLLGIFAGRTNGQCFHSLDEMIINSVNLYCSNEFWNGKTPYFCFANSHFNRLELPFTIIPSISYTPDSLIPRKAYKAGVDIINVDVDVKMNQLIIYLQYEVEKRKNCFSYNSEVQSWTRHLYEFCDEEQGWKLIKVESHSI